MFVRHDAVALDPYTERTEARWAQALRWGCPGQTDERYPVPVVLENLASQPPIVTLGLHPGQPEAHRPVSILTPGQSKALGANRSGLPRNASTNWPGLGAGSLV